MEIVSYLEKRGWLGVDSTFRGKIDEWKDWYQGDVESFHRYSVYNGICSIERKRRKPSLKIGPTYFSTKKHKSQRVDFKKG